MSENDLETPETVQSPGAMLADEMYAKPETPEPETQQVDKEVPAPVDEQVDVKPEETEEQVDETPAEEISEDEVEVTSIEQLAEHLETDKDWLLGLKTTQKVNGKEIEISVADALSNTRMQVAGDEYLADAKAKAKQIIETNTQSQQDMLATGATVAALLQQAESLVDSGMKEEDWARLRREDPAEYSAKKEEVREKRAAIENMKAQAREVLSKVGEATTQREEAMLTERLPAEQQKFLEMVPEWNDPDVVAKESEELSNYFTANNLSADEVKMVSYNATYLNMARNSMLFERSKGKIDVAKKKVTKIPKVLKPGKAAEDTKPKVDSNDPVSILYG